MNSTSAIPAASDIADTPRIPLGLRASWGIGSFGTITYLNVVTALVMVYLTTIMKVEPGVAGAIVFAARLVDALLDPVMGWVTDRTRTSIGRRRPWLLAGAIVCGLGLPLVYSQHNLELGVSASLTALIVLIFYSIGFTMFNVPYLTMPVEMTQDRMQRLGLMSYRSVFMMLGAVAGSAGAPVLVEKLGRDADAFQTLGYVTGAVVFAAMLVTFLGTRGAHAPDTDAASLRVPLREQAQAVIGNRPFMMMVGIKVLQFFALSAEGATSAFFVIMVLKRDLSLMSILAVATIGSTIACIPLFRWLGRRIPKRTGLAIGMVGVILTTLTWLFATPETPNLFYILRGIAMGAFGSAFLLYSQAMWLDTIDHDRERTGLRREGLYTSVYVFIERLGYSLGPLALGELLQAMHFNKNLPLEQQPATAEVAVLVALVGIPVCAYLGGLLFLWFYRIEEKLDR
ncbi:MAG: MFS transporter [Steroidobacteraceae bacterium]